MHAVVALVAFLATTPALAHDWFTGTTDPASGHACCTGPGLSFAHVDCMAVPADLLTAGVIEETAEGYRVRLTLDQAKRFNDQTTKPIDEIVPWSRVQPGALPGSRHVHLAKCGQLLLHSEQYMKSRVLEALHVGSPL